MIEILLILSYKRHFGVILIHLLIAFLTSYDTKQTLFKGYFVIWGIKKKCLVLIWVDGVVGGKIFFLDLPETYLLFELYKILHYHGTIRVAQSFSFLDFISIIIIKTLHKCPEKYFSLTVSLFDRQSGIIIPLQSQRRWLLLYSLTESF